ncbi:Bud site selection protein 6 [Mortierella alpina]|uniref:Bud site selection protein 6 n=1 Tax=Mortierella alpina TaxID=64518 RepID=A0A9P6M5Z6_MORAP|nr:Bud site selection protein 6 [Mortierella alpina]
MNTMEVIQEQPRRSFDHGSPHLNPSNTPPTARRRKTDHSSNPIEATVTKLLVATKQLLESLTSWSNRKMTEEQVSDIFVQLATQFNLASHSFHEVGIDTSELAHIPDDLRNCLEMALGEEPSPVSLDQYLPNIKSIIIKLLQGLRQKQNIFRDQNELKAAGQQTPPRSHSPLLANTPGTLPATNRVNGSHIRQPSVGRVQELAGGAGMLSAGAAGAQLSTRMPSMTGATTPTMPMLTPRDGLSHEETLASLRKSDTITRRASSRRHSQRFSTLLEQNTPPPAMPRRQHPLSDSNLMTTYPGYVSQGASPMTSPHLGLPYGQFSTLPSPAQEPLPVSPSLPTTSRLSSLQAMPLPPTTPMPPLPVDDVQQQPDTTIVETAASTISDTSEAVIPAPKVVLNDTDELDPLTASTSEPGETPEPLASITSMQPEPVTLVLDPVETSLTLFLQVGKSVKKTKFEGELTLSGLRMLFMEKFQYNPGQDDFPTIYVKDPHTNIHYELESLADVRQNAFLSLNVDDLENIQRKMDQGFAALTKEILDIKKSQEVMEQARHKTAVAAAAAAVVLSNQTERGLTPTHPEGSQALRSVIQKVLVRHKTAPAASPSSTLAKLSASDLKAQQEEVQTLRRDLGVVRQLYTELQTETKSMLGHLAGYTSQIRKQALDSPVSSRMFIETGKVKLDKKSEDLTNKIEELQDVVEDMKVNVTQRRGRPSDISMAFVDKQCAQVEQEIKELADYIQTLRPSWKKTWEVELQTIVKEQMFLKEQEALLEDLKEDRSSLLQTLGNLKKVMELQVKNGSQGLKSKEFLFQPMPEEGFEGLKTVMEEVKLIAPDSDRRLKAMAQMEKLRHIELSNRIDEFEEELTTFVGASKLRKTGGALEAERQRQQRDSENLKAMFASATNRPPDEC